MADTENRPAPAVVLTAAAAHAGFGRRRPEAQAAAVCRPASP